MSSLRIRSFVATCLFMLVSMITAMATNTSTYLPIFENTLPIERAGSVVGVCLLVCVSIIILSILLGTRLSLDAETLSMRVFTSTTEVR